MFLVDERDALRKPLGEGSGCDTEMKQWFYSARKHVNVFLIELRPQVMSTNEVAK